MVSLSPVKKKQRNFTLPPPTHKKSKGKGNQIGM